MSERVTGASAVILAAALAFAIALPASVAAQEQATQQPTAQERGAEQLVVEAVEAYRRALEGADRDERLAAFRRAERLFQAAIEAGHLNAELHANWGTAALQAERLGTAVLAYRRALLFEPGLERAQQNLRQARSLLPDWIPTPADDSVLDTFFFWSATTSAADRATAAALCFALALLALSAGILLRSTGPRYIAIPAGLAWAVLIASIGLDPSRDAADDGVVVAARETVARAADSINAPSRFGEPLPGGTELQILEDRGGWLHVELHNGRNAWVIASAVERVAPGS